MRPKRQGTDGIPFGKILKNVMSERGLTVRAVAEMAGVSSSVVQNWLSQASPHDLQSVARLAKALDIGFKALLLGEVEEIARTPEGLEDLFDEQDFFDGICRVKIQRLVPRKGKT